MDMQTLREQIEDLDPQVHKALRHVLTAEYNREMFKKAADELNRRYIEGTIDYIRKHHPDLYQKMNEAEDRLNEGWKAGLQGKVAIEEFRKILKEWYLLHLQGIEIYSKEQGKQER